MAILLKGLGALMVGARFLKCFVRKASEDVGYGSFGGIGERTLVLSLDSTLYGTQNW